MEPYGTTDGSISAAFLSVLQLSAARARIFELGHKNSVLNCIGHGEMLFAALALRAALLVLAADWAASAFGDYQWIQ